MHCLFGIRGKAEGVPARFSGGRFDLRSGGKDGHAGEGFQALQKVRDFDVGVAVVAVLDLGTLAEEGVGFVEEEDGTRGIGGC